MNFYRDIDRYRDRTAVITEQGEELTYKVFLGNADCLYEDLQMRSVLFLICRNCLESVCAYIGALRNDVVPVMINAGIDVELFKHLYEAYHPMYVYAPEDWENLNGIQLKDIRRYRGFVLYRTSWQQDYELNKELALLLTTSGSTGSPKLVRQSYENITANANSIAEYLNILEDDRAITTMPMSYTYCLSIINSHFLKGACMIMNEYSVVQREFWTIFKELKPTTFGGVPFIYEQLKALRFGRMELPSIRYITQAGGKLSKERAEEFNEICEKKGIKLIIMYGQTEATARMSYLPWEKAREKAGSMGIAIPGGKFSLVDADGNEITDSDVVGELIYQGENVTLGYAEGCYDLNKGDENHGLLHTGDMAKRDADGFYYIVGRKKRFLKMYGNRVNLDEVEGLLKKQGYSCVCAGEDDRLKIYLTEKNEAVWQEIKEFLSHTLGFTMKSFEVIGIDEIPRNEAGKVLYSALK
ncbi:MAG: AMP-binding protein [Lachnospiraceae bacterium]|nr:AMP-binding protein [Lachnospiraceae bacterium]